MVESKTPPTVQPGQAFTAADLASTDVQRIELALELLANVPGKAVSGARSLLRSALRKL